MAVVRCPRCMTRNPAGARFCGRCGVKIDERKPVKAKTPEPARHPDGLPAPEGFRPVEGVADLYYTWKAAWGGSMLLGTETIGVVLFNGGYPLEEVVLKVCGTDPQAKPVFAVERTLDELPRGQEVTVEVPSYEVPAPASDLVVRLLSGRYAVSQ